jgi:hypothetical protein
MTDKTKLLIWKIIAIIGLVIAIIGVYNDKSTNPSLAWFWVECSGITIQTLALIGVWGAQDRLELKRKPLTIDKG